MERSFEKPKACDECNKKLNLFFLFCRTCNRYICYECFKNHNIEHEYIPCKSIDANNAVAIDVGSGAYGAPSGDEWPAIDIDDFESNHYDKCEHAEDYLKKNNIIFSTFSSLSGKWICLNCLENHLDDNPMLHVGFDNGKKLRQIDPNLYSSDKKPVLNLKTSKNDKNTIKIELDIFNNNEVSLLDLDIVFSWDNLDESFKITKSQNKDLITYFVEKKEDSEDLIDDIFCYNTINNEEHIFFHGDMIDLIKASESIKKKYEIKFSDGINSNLSTLIIFIYFKDAFLGQNRCFKKSKVINI